MRSNGTVLRLESVSTSLVTALRHAAEIRQRAACLVACEFAVVQTGISSSTVQRALQLLRALKPIPAELKQGLDVLTQQLDDKYFDFQEAAEDGNVSEDEWKQVFSQARAASALAFASGENAFDAASEAIYEAAATVDEPNELLSIVLKTLA